MGDELIGRPHCAEYFGFFPRQEYFRNHRVCLYGHHHHRIGSAVYGSDLRGRGDELRPHARWKAVHPKQEGHRLSRGNGSSDIFCCLHFPVF